MTFFALITALAARASVLRPPESTGPRVLLMVVFLLLRAVFEGEGGTERPGRR